MKYSQTLSPDDFSPLSPMKKYILFILLFFSGLIPLSPLSAAWETTTWESTSSMADHTSTVVVTEIVPGTDISTCKCLLTNGEWSDTPMTKDWQKTCETNIAKKKYKCEMKWGMESFTKIFSGMIRWIVNISMLLAVLALVVMGILWSTTGADSDKVKAVKWWFINILIGLLILFFFRAILGFLAPWVYK